MTPEKLALGAERLKQSYAVVDVIGRNGTPAHGGWASIVVRMDGDKGDSPMLVMRLNKMIKAFNNFDAMIDALEQLAAIELLANKVPDAARDLGHILRNNQIATNALKALKEQP